MKNLIKLVSSALAAFAMTGAVHAGNSRIAVTIPVNTLSATTTVTSAMLGTNIKAAELAGVSYVTPAGSFAGVTSTVTIITANTNTISGFATVGASSNDASVTCTGVPVVQLGELIVVTLNKTNAVPHTTLMHIRDSIGGQGVNY